MTPEARAGIGNGIWLCASHGRLVDTDDVTYTAEVLHRFKAWHEARCKQALGFIVGAGRPGGHLVALGPEIVCIGDIDRVEGARWRIGIDISSSASSRCWSGFPAAWRQRQPMTATF